MKSRPHSSQWFENCDVSSWHCLIKREECKGHSWQGKGGKKIPCHLKRVILYQGKRTQKKVTVV